MAVGNWFAFGHFTGKEGVLGQLFNLVGAAGGALSGQGTTSFVSDSGSVYLFDDQQAANLRAHGLQGYNSEAQAIANPNENISQAQIDQIANSTPSVSQTSDPFTQAQNTVGKAVSNPLDWLSNIGDFFSKLGQAHTWLRIAEVLAGMVLVGIGLNAMLKGKPMRAVTGTVGLAGKAAMF